MRAILTDPVADVLKQYERAIQLPVLRATSRTRDRSLQDRRTGRVSEGKRRLVLDARVLGECVRQRPEIRDARIAALYDVKFAEIRALDDLVDFFMRAGR
jgi:hypothetical protein